MRIYVATSWRNGEQPAVVRALRELGHDVYDFRHPEPLSQSPEAPIAEAAFRLDMDALMACDVCVLVQPCGRSAHLEMGFAVGAGKETYVLLVDGQEPELMYKMCHFLVTSIADLVKLIGHADREGSA